MGQSAQIRSFYPKTVGNWGEGGGETFPATAAETKGDFHGNCRALFSTVTCTALLGTESVHTARYILIKPYGGLRHVLTGRLRAAERGRERGLSTGDRRSPRSTHQVRLPHTGTDGSSVRRVQTHRYIHRIYCQEGNKCALSEAGFQRLSPTQTIIEVKYLQY